VGGESGWGVVRTLSVLIGRDLVGAGRGAGDAVGRPRRVRRQHLAQRREGALQLPRQRR